MNRVFVIEYLLGHGPVKQFDVSKIVVTNYLMNEMIFNEMKFYQWNFIAKG